MSEFRILGLGEIFVPASALDRASSTIYYNDDVLLLIEHIAQNGIIVPLTVEEVQVGYDLHKTYYLVDGALRYYAALVLGMETVPVVVYS